MGASYVGLTLDSIEEYGEMLVGYDAEVRQVEAGPLELTHEAADFGPVRVLRWSTNRMLSSHLICESGWTVIGAAQRSPIPSLRCNGVEVSPDNLVVSSNAEESHTVERAGLALIEVMIRDDLMESYGLMADAGQVVSRPELGRRMLSSKAASLYRARMNGLIDIVAYDPSRSSPRGLDGVLEAVGEVLSAAGRTAGSPTREMSSDPDLVHRCVDLLRQSDLGELNLLDLSQALGTTPRTLQRSFRAVMGVSPYQYVLRHRLNDARAMLRRRDDLTITEVARRFGFTSSAFGAHYRRLFGEPPSALRARIAAVEG